MIQISPGLRIQANFHGSFLSHRYNLRKAIDLLLCGENSGRTFADPSMHSWVDSIEQQYVDDVLVSHQDVPLCRALMKVEWAVALAYNKPEGERERLIRELEKKANNF